MGIRFLEDIRSWKLDTKGTSYVIHAVDEEGFLVHGYFGERIGDDDIRYTARLYEPPFTPSVNNRDRGVFLDSAPFEYPAYGTGDFRDSAIEIETEEGYRAVSLLYDGYRIYKGKPGIPGQPATFAGEDEAETLELYALDKLTGLKVTLYYTIFHDLDVITRRVTVLNDGTQTIKLLKVMSVCIDMDNEDYDVISLNGAWSRERHIQRQRVGIGKYAVGSLRGESSHQANPFLAVLDHNATQENGRVYGFNLVYSGNFLAQCERSQWDSVRILLGIHPGHFCFKLEKGERFEAPEAVLVYSNAGLDKMTQTFHDLYRRHLIRSPYKDKERPVLINNWEATYFDFDSEKLLGIAKEAAKSGIEMLVMDDGWFGNRDTDDMALGDWYVNEKKLRGGLKKLVDEINQIEVAGSGKKMQFGIWVEPEMISPDSDLYREHPDWAIGIPNRTGTLIRNQYVLDLSRREVIERVYGMIHDVLASANIAYVKWDMNRALSDIAGAELPADRQGELMHRYVLGLYEMQERLITDFPGLLLENCSGGGGRYDPGMLYYSPQIWCSDDADAIERLSIQEGTALVYPLSTMGAHICDCPNHVVFRNTPFKTRGHVALSGTFGYELDVTKISEEDRALIPSQVKMYHKYHSLIRNGDYYRIDSFSQNHLWDVSEVVAKDKSEALVTYVQVLGRPNFHSVRIHLRGLDPEAKYEVSAEDKILCLADEADTIVLTGATIMNAGLNVGPQWGELRGDFVSTLIYLKRV